MSSIQLAPYVLRFQNKTIHEPSKLTDSYDSNDNLFNCTEFFQLFFSDLKEEYSNNEELKQLIRISSWQAKHENGNYEFYGIIKTGEYGEETELVDIVTEESRIRKKSEAELRPFYFHIYYPNKSERALLVLERIGNIGVRTVFTNCIQKRLKDFSSEEHSLDVAHLFHREAFDKYLEDAEVKKLRFIQYSLPADIADQFDMVNMGVKVEDFEFEFVIKAKMNKSIPIFQKVCEFITDDPTNDSGALLELKVINKDFEAQETKVEIKSHGRIKTISMKNIKATQTYLDITELIRKDDTGFPLFEDIHREGIEYIRLISRRLGWKNS